MQNTKQQPDLSPATRGKKIAAVVSIAAFITVLVLLSIFVGGPLVKNLGDPAAFRAWVDAHGIWGRMLFVGLMALQVIVAFIPGEPFELAAGYAFGLLAMRVKERVLINTGLILAVVGVVLLALPLGQVFSLAGILLFGLGCAPVFPNLIHITPQRFGKNYSQAIIGLQMASAYLGSTLIPPLVGWIGQNYGFSWLPYFLLACLALLYMTIVVCNRQTGFGQTKTEAA